MELFHVSEEAGITEFVPRPPPNASSGVDYPAVFAIEDEFLRNYLLPRDCPRVTFFQSAESSSEDVERIIGPSNAKVVVAIESAWFARVREARLYVYTMPSDGFELIDNGAGYWVNRKSVRPTNVRMVSDCVGEILKRGVELRVMESLWNLQEAVIKSSLGFSCIRMRNAKPRE